MSTCTEFLSTTDQKMHFDFALYVHTKPNNASFPFWKTGRILLCTCPSSLLPLAVALFQPLPHILQIVKKRPLTAQVGDLSLLHYAHPFIGHTISDICIVVHAVGHQLALRRQGKVLNEFLCSSEPLLQALMLPDVKRALAHGRGHPAIRWVSLINVHQQKISYITEVLHQLPESWQVADERGSGGWSKVDHQRAIQWLKIQKATLISISDLGTRWHISHVTDIAGPGKAIRHLHQFGVWCLAAKFYLKEVKRKREKGIYVIHTWGVMWTLSCLWLCHILVSQSLWEWDKEYIQ